MKILEFRCNDCKEVFEVTVLDTQDFWCVCPKCKSSNTARIFSSFKFDFSKGLKKLDYK